MWAFRISTDEGRSIIRVDTPCENLGEAERYVQCLYPDGILVERYQNDFVKYREDVA